MPSNLKILLISEGTYPFYGGGISTWSHMLCERTKGIDFFLYSINAGFVKEPIFNIGENVKDIIQVPLWAPDEPQDYVSYKRDYYKVASRKESTSPKIIQEKFVPLFSEFMLSVYEQRPDMKNLDRLFKKMWKYFQAYDYKVTMKDFAVWDTFKQISTSNAPKNLKVEPSLYDLTVGMRWLYRFFIPLSIPVPKVDLTHITLSGFPLIPALASKYRYGTPLIITEHGVYVRERLLYINRSDYSYFIKDLLIKLTEMVTRLSYHKADKILSVNKFNQTWEKMYGADPSKLQVTYNGVDHLKFVPGEKPDHLKNIPTVVAAARIFELKDILTMIKTCAVVKRSIDNVQFLIYGDKGAVPKYTEACENLIKELKLQDNFHLKGHHSDPHSLYKEGDISILTSISEGFPFTVIESMSCGVPVVATDVGGVAEAIDEKSGFVCKPRDADEIGKRVIQLLSDNDLRKQMGAHARNRVTELFTLDIFIKNYEEVYHQVFNESKIKVAI